MQRKCVGFGATEGKCTNNANGEKYNSQYWCDKCERIRRDTIKKQLTKIAEDLERRSKEGDY